MVFDAGDILNASGINYFSVNATGFYTNKHIGLLINLHTSDGYIYITEQIVKL